LPHPVIRPCPLTNFYHQPKPRSVQLPVFCVIFVTGYRAFCRYRQMYDTHSPEIFWLYHL